ncbi:hypothetical protein GCM10022237_01730 [Nocardioides ginsengisoli]
MTPAWAAMANSAKHSSDKSDGVGLGLRIDRVEVAPGEESLGGGDVGLASGEHAGLLGGQDGCGGEIGGLHPPMVLEHMFECQRGGLAAVRLCDASAPTSAPSAAAASGRT